MTLKYSSSAELDARLHALLQKRKAERSAASLPPEIMKRADYLFRTAGIAAANSYLAEQTLILKGPKPSKESLVTELVIRGLDSIGA